MTDLFIFDDKVESVFQLLGQKENDISYSVGYAFANCRHFLDNFLKHLNIKTPFEPEKIKIKLQTHEKEKGFTDFEIIQEGEFHLIVEAKRGWVFPTDEQLKKYASRQSFKKSAAKDKRIIVFNESTTAFTQAHFAMTAISSVPVQVVSWQTVQNLTNASIKIGRDTENRLLRDLNKYLDKISTMQKIDSNRVFVVSLGGGNPDNWKISWQDIVNKRHRYFHPVGGSVGGWPAEPPNYIAFRYNGQLQSIHHIDNYEVFKNHSDFFPEAPKVKWDGVHHYLYHLGQAIKPQHEVRAGKKIVRSMRVWAALDLLLTCKTIQDARDKTKQRENNQN